MEPEELKHDTDRAAVPDTAPAWIDIGLDLALLAVLAMLWAKHASETVFVVVLVFGWLISRLARRGAIAYARRRHGR